MRRSHFPPQVDGSIGEVDVAEPVLVLETHFPPRVDGSIGEFDVAEPVAMQRDHPCVSLRAAEFTD